MYKVKYEIYKNDYQRETDLIKTFNSLDAIGKWLLEHATPYKPKNEYRGERNFLHVTPFRDDIPSRLESRNYDTDSNIWIYLITTDNTIQPEDKIIYSGGHYTANKKFMSGAILEWVQALEKEYKTNEFNFDFSDTGLFQDNK